MSPPPGASIVSGLRSQNPLFPPRIHLDFSSSARTPSDHARARRGPGRCSSPRSRLMRGFAIRALRDCHPPQDLPCATATRCRDTRGHRPPHISPAVDFLKPR
ncbi:hypothetical protein AV530_004498 [Patagioenas fasciata monilis]|uniref:Uncharacterized protein n=1 Tax=Patagioenas fasciata monilis TaxID=372326 RepID=A0A1V4JCE7_PATFA|nr:hypothetical protein AV530_004498 [Patagioenas fasciata monilis]